MLAMREKFHARRFQGAVLRGRPPKGQHQKRHDFEEITHG